MHFPHFLNKINIGCFKGCDDEVFYAVILLKRLAEHCGNFKIFENAIEFIECFFGGIDQHIRIFQE
jgi:hypothetical protein